MRASDAVRTLSQGVPLVGQQIEAALNLTELVVDDNITVPITIRDCTIDSIDGSHCQFSEPVVLDNVVILRDTSFFASYFFAGVHIRRSQFGGTLDFQCGGHNKGTNQFLLDGCQFAGFVNFFDCWFEGPVIVRECRFRSGSNLFGNDGQPYAVRFDVCPVLKANSGALDLDGG